MTVYHLDELDLLVGKVVHVIETDSATYFRVVSVQSELFDAMTWVGEEAEWLARGRFFVSRCMWNVTGESDGNARSSGSGALPHAASGGASEADKVWMYTWREDWPPGGVPEGRSCELRPVVLFSFSASAASDL